VKQRRQRTCGSTGEDMASRLRFALVIFFFAGTLILAVYLHSTDHRIFYTLRRYKIEQARLQQELWQKQLRLESVTNPASVSTRLGL
jgi:preprotein translocase subunit SecG